MKYSTRIHYALLAGLMCWFLPTVAAAQVSSDPPTYHLYKKQTLLNQSAWWLLYGPQCRDICGTCRELWVVEDGETHEILDAYYVESTYCITTTPSLVWLAIEEVEKFLEQCVEDGGDVVPPGITNNPAQCP